MAAHIAGSGTFFTNGLGIFCGFEYRRSFTAPAWLSVTWSAFAFCLGFTSIGCIAIAVIMVFGTLAGTSDTCLAVETGSIAVPAVSGTILGVETCIAAQFKCAAVECAGAIAAGFIFFACIQTFAAVIGIYLEIDAYAEADLLSRFTFGG